MPLTRVEITQRNRKRKKIIKEELAKYGIQERRFYVDDKLYTHFTKIAEDLDKDVHSLLFLAMRHLISQSEPSSNLDEHYFMLESAMMNVHVLLDSSETLGSPREAQKYIKPSKD